MPSAWSPFFFLRATREHRQKATVVKIVFSREESIFFSGLLVFLGGKLYRLPYMSAKRHKVSEEDAIGDLHVLGSVVFDLLFSPKSLPQPRMTTVLERKKKQRGERSKSSVQLGKRCHHHRPVGFILWLRLEKTSLVKSLDFKKRWREYGQRAREERGGNHDGICGNRRKR